MTYSTTGRSPKPGSAAAILGVVVGAVGLLTLVGTAEATVALRLSVPQLTAEADVVIRGKVLSSQSSRTADKRSIVTHTEVAVSRVLRGDAPATLRVRQLGGVVDGTAMDLAGNARLGKNEEVILFLKLDSQYAYVVGLAQGKFSIGYDARGNEIATRDLSGISFVSRFPQASPGRVAFKPGGYEPAMRVTDLISQVQGKAMTRSRILGTLVMVALLVGASRSASAFNLAEAKWGLRRSPTSSTWPARARWARPPPAT